VSLSVSLQYHHADRGKSSPIVFLDEMKYWEEEEPHTFELNLDFIDCIYISRLSLFYRGVSLTSKNVIQL